MPRLTIQDHSRDSSGMTYVYPVISRRAGGVSVGINLNVNNACNWRCIYCQVPDLQRGRPPPIDLGWLEMELQDLLTQLYRGDFLERHAPPEARKVVDIAFSGNGEPTSAAEFAEAVALVGRIIDGFGLAQPPTIRLITNGSLLDREAVQRGIGLLAARQGEIWFKVDAVGAEAMKRINDVAYEPEIVLKRLKCCTVLCPTWVQTCWFAFDGLPPTESDINRYIDLLMQARVCLSGVLLYGIARPSMQAEAHRLSALPASWLEIRAEEIRKKTGLTVKVSP
jgi:wyosine [tRNA(Phe)-imidazoG37] synthetase (radical SAM superfamily)